MASKPVELTPEAQEELQAAAAYYDGKQAGLGGEFLDCVLEALRRIGEAPDGHPLVPASTRTPFVKRGSDAFRIDYPIWTWATTSACWP